MSTKAGVLLWNRLRVTVPGGAPGTLNVDTGITQVNKSGDPSFDDPSRIQVMPLAPIDGWANITHGEPFLDPATGTIHVVFSNASVNPTTINVLAWNPHSLIGPGDADTYNP